VKSQGLVNPKFNFFKYKEFVVSSKFPELAKKITLSKENEQCIRLLCDSVLIPVRARFGLTIIESGKRSEELNKQVGGSPKSQHIDATAADIRSSLAENLEIFKWIHGQKLPFRQLIYYEKTNGLHVSINVPWRTFKNEVFIFRKNGEKETWS